ncbi:MAG: AhpC/TSA family protein [Acidiferrobacterales bacterium]|nr:AhpC/TSA family protein [Acidiferrobacterales bacterium]
MKLVKHDIAPDFEAIDTKGQKIRLSDYRGRPVVISFFRDASCPLCNARVFDYSLKHREWKALGIEIITVFSSPDEKINEFNDKYERKFTTIGDPNLKLYDLYGIEKSPVGFFKALVFRIPQILKGFAKGGRPDPKNPHGALMPADFIISPSGKILQAWYGKDAGQHIPMTFLDQFIRQIRLIRIKQNRQQKNAITQMQIRSKKNVVDGMPNNDDRNSIEIASVKQTQEQKRNDDVNLKADLLKLHNASKIKTSLHNDAEFNNVAYSSTSNKI